MGIKNLQLASGLLALVVLIGCNNGGGASSLSSPNENQNLGDGSPVGSFPIGSSPTGQEPSTDEPLSFCSKLNFDGLDWPANLSILDRNYLALAMNISGSFEGDDGWQNLTNNFDGQGLSFGLLNQCLGQGSLQPLLIKMRDVYPAELKSELSATNLTSVLGMLSTWEKQVSATSRVRLQDYGLSPLDDPSALQEALGIDQVSAQLLAKNQQSVNWAVANLYKGSSFKPDWKTQLLGLSTTAGYRSIQTAAAISLHNATVKLTQHYQLKSMRSYLFFFDIVVQNGGIPAAADATILADFKKNPTWDETHKLNDILTVRLKYVNQKYVNDVKARKASIINGTGTVHGVRRNYEKEYCMSKVDIPLSMN